MSDVTIRKLHHTDSLEELTGLLHAAYAELGRMGLNYLAVDQTVETTRRRVSAGVCFVALVESKIVGTIVVEPASDDPECPYFVQNHVPTAHQLGVVPAHQRSGVGSRLWEHAESWARANGYSELGLDTVESAKHLIEIYMRRGYIPVGSIQGVKDSFPTWVYIGALLITLILGWVIYTQVLIIQFSLAKFKSA